MPVLSPPSFINKSVAVLPFLGSRRYIYLCTEQVGSSDAAVFDLARGGPQWGVDGLVRAALAHRVRTACCSYAALTRTSPLTALWVAPQVIGPPLAPVMGGMAGPDSPTQAWPRLAVQARPSLLLGDQVNSHRSPTRRAQGTSGSPRAAWGWAMPHCQTAERRCWEAGLRPRSWLKWRRTSPPQLPLCIKIGDECSAGIGAGEPLKNLNGAPTAFGPLNPYRSARAGAVLL